MKPWDFTLSEMEPPRVLSMGGVIWSFVLKGLPWLLCHDTLEGGKRRNEATGRGRSKEIVSLRKYVAGT